MSSETIVTIDERLLSRIGIREWGLPSLRIPGQIWRSEKNGTISCMTPRDATSVNIETLPLMAVEAGTKSSMPNHWRAALWEYVQKYPMSGHGYGPFLAISEPERCDFVRKLAENLLKGDNIACLVRAHAIGEIAAFDYDTEAQP